MDNSTQPAFASYSSQDARQVYYLAKAMLRNWAVLVTMIGLYGIILVINGMAFYSLINRRPKLRSTWILMASLFTVFAITSIRTGVLGALNFLHLKGHFIDTPQLSLRQRIMNLRGSDMYINLLAVDTILSAAGGNLSLVFIISDSLAVWRAIKICTPPFYVVYGFVFLLVSNLAIWITGAVFDMMRVFQDRDIPNSMLKHIAVIYFTGSALSITISAIATGMIAYKAYRYRKAFTKSVASKFQSGRILILLAESGLVYVVFQIIAVALTAAPTENTLSEEPVFTAMSLWQQFDSAVAAMYTPTIILIVSRKMSLADTIRLNATSPEPGDTEHTRAISTLAFASYHSRGNHVRSEVTNTDDIPTDVDSQGLEKSSSVAASRTSV